MKEFRKGVTLIELVLVLALVGIVLQVVYSIFFVGNVSYSISSNKGFSQQDVRILGDFLISELKYITEMSTTDVYVDSYYSIKIDNVDGKKILTKTLHKYNGDGLEVDKDSVTDKTKIRTISGNWNALTISNTIPGEINILISQEEGSGNSKSRYELPLKISTINDWGLITGIDGFNIANGGTLYYRNNLSNLLTNGIDIKESNPSDNKVYNINFYTDKDEPYETKSGKSGSIIDMPIKPTKTDFNFMGWNTDPNGNDFLYTGDKFTIPNKDLNLYAIWKNSTPDPKSILSNLEIKGVYEHNNKLASISNGVYEVQKKKNVKVVVGFSYNKPTSNLEIVVTGSIIEFSKNITGTGTSFEATLIGETPSSGTPETIKIEIREINDHSNKDYIEVKYKLSN